MSEMPDRNAMPPAADHEHHEAMLVSQLAAGDALEPEQLAVTQRLVGSCGACASLANDLRVVSAAVAQEPIPPRRRDFRLSPEQAEELSGNAFTRFLRRLSLPSSRVFQPAAAGVLSVGLLFVVAGYAWPDGGTITVQAEPNFATDVSPAPAAAAGAEMASPAPEPDPDDLAAAEGLGAAELDAEFFETLPESQAGTADTFEQKSIVDEAEQLELAEEAAMAQQLEPAEEAAVAEDAAGGAAKRAADSRTAPEAPAPAPADEDRSGSDASDAVAADPQEADLRSEERAVEAPAEEPAPVEESRALPEPEAVTEVASDGALAGDVVVTASDDGGPDELLVALGVLLALTGSGLLVLGWLVRRARDPLAP